MMIILPRAAMEAWKQTYDRNYAPIDPDRLFLFGICCSSCQNDCCLWSFSRQKARYYGDTPSFLKIVPGGWSWVNCPLVLSSFSSALFVSNLWFSRSSWIAGCWSLVVRGYELSRLVEEGLKFFWFRWRNFLGFAGDHVHVTMILDWAVQDLSWWCKVYSCVD